MKPGFYNDNRFRAYPFLRATVNAPAAPTTVTGLDNNTIVDAGFIMGLYSGFDAAVHSVWLDSITRLGTALTFTFRSDAPGLYKRPLTFTRSTTAAIYEVQHVEDVEAAYGTSEVSDSAVFAVSDESPDLCPPEPLWSGFLVTGDLHNLITGQLAVNGTLSRGTGGGVIEPALIQNLAGSYVESINLANEDRTRIDPPAGCPDNAQWPFPTGEGHVYVNARCLRGDVRFKAGYNSTVRQDPFSNAVVFGAVIGAGAGEICNDEPKLFPGETPPPGSSLLEGGPRCNEVVRSINGIGGRYANLLGGLGVNVIAVPDQHKVIIDINMNRLTVCYSDHPFSEVSEHL